MRGVSEADASAEALLAWYLNKGREKPYVNPRMQRNCTVVEGFYVDRTTGVVCGRHLELDTNSGSAAPIYYLTITIIYNVPTRVLLFVFFVIIY